MRSNGRTLHDNGNGTFDPDRVLAARSVALREAIRLELGLARGSLNDEGLSESEAVRARVVVERSARRLERWILRPLDDEDEADG